MTKNSSTGSKTNSSTNSKKNAGAVPAVPATDATPIDATVRTSVRQYLAEIDGELPTDFYQLVLSQVEAPLLEEVMRHTRNNQTRAAHLLGLNRGTLRKKLRLYRLYGEP
ncbi:DNA-binding transcriptional regulator Fis [Pseudohaliea sp.]|uniref:DNA-binding transcriptional regulator Fis n=1 Tax=Pseudohaliea sp. TaxID=2740289 RepID=UPI0032EABA54